MKAENKVKEDLGELGQSVLPLKQSPRASHNTNVIINAPPMPIVISAFFLCLSGNPTALLPKSNPLHLYGNSRNGKLRRNATGTKESSSTERTEIPQLCQKKQAAQTKKKGGGSS